MDLFFLSWAFDARWLFNIKNPCRELVFTLPLIINLTSTVMCYIQNKLQTQNQHILLIEDILFSICLAISNIYIISIVRLNTVQKMGKVKDNYIAIQQFYHDYQIKKVIWSVVGIIITVLALCKTIINNLYISQYQNVYPCQAIKIRYYLDLISYSYILFNISMFLLFKITYILSAWVCCPKFYLKVKKILQ